MHRLAFRLAASNRLTGVNRKSRIITTTAKNTAAVNAGAPEGAADLVVRRQTPAEGSDQQRITNRPISQTLATRRASPDDQYQRCQGLHQQRQACRLLVAFAGGVL